MLLVYCLPHDKLGGLETVGMWAALQVVVGEQCASRGACVATVSFALAALQPAVPCTASRMVAQVMINDDATQPSQTPTCMPRMLDDTRAKNDPSNTDCAPCSSVSYSACCAASSAGYTCINWWVGCQFDGDGPTVTAGWGVAVGTMPAPPG